MKQFKEKLLLIYNWVVFWFPVILAIVFCIFIFSWRIKDYKEKRDSILLTQELIKEKFSQKDCVQNETKWACLNSTFKCFFDGEETICEMKTENGFKRYKFQDEVDIRSFKK